MAGWGTLSGLLHMQREQTGDAIECFHRRILNVRHECARLRHSFGPDERKFPYRSFQALDLLERDGFRRRCGARPRHGFVRRRLSRLAGIKLDVHTAS